MSSSNPPARGELRAKDLTEDYVTDSIALAGVVPGRLKGAGSSRIISSAQRGGR